MVVETFVIAVSFQDCKQCNKRTMHVQLQDTEGHLLEMCKKCLEQQTADILED